MTILLTCDQYSTIREVDSDNDLPALCRAEEQHRNDGFAVVASTDGQIVADAEGWRQADEYYRDHATASGAYD